MPYDLERLFETIDARVSDSPDLTLHDLARRLLVDRHTIEKAVHYVHDRSFRDFHRRKRLEKALALFADHGELSCKQVSAAVGFRSADAFTRFVKSMTGKTPTQLRKEQRTRP
jgi:transcriptional regulator GlxA family with amidase domain